MATSGAAVAAGGAHGTAMDLIPAFINISILFGILGFVLRKPVKAYYNSKSEEVSNILERASIKAKEAEMMMEAQRKKVESVAGEIEQLYKDTDERIATFKKDYASEVDNRIEKLKEDAAQKIEAEKAEQMNKLNSTFLDDVIEKAKAYIKKNPALGNEATDKVLEGLKK